MTSHKNLIHALLAGTVLATTIGSTGASVGQEIADLATSEPLTLASRGSLVIGGESVLQTPQQLSSITGEAPAEEGNVTLNQMYVDFMVPQEASGTPIILLHGATLSGKTFDTSPDGRMGWFEYFVRQGYPTYVADQASRARSGVDIAIYNDVRAGDRPASDLPNAFRISSEDGLAQFRIGVRNGAPFDDTQFPVEFLDELAAQSVPDFNAGLPQPNPTYAALADLSNQVGGAIVMGHSEGGTFPLQAALSDPTGIEGMVLLEPGICHEAEWTEEQMNTFADIPLLVVFGDHVEAQGTVPGFTWQGAFEDCELFVSEVNEAGGDATMLHLPEAGQTGNSHLFMMERNNIEIADLLIDWIKERA